MNAKQDMTSEPAAPDRDGLMSASDKVKLDSFGDVSEYVRKSDILTAYRYRGKLMSYEDLPGDSTVGDVYDIDEGMNYAWTGTRWDELGSPLSIESIEEEDIDNLMDGNTEDPEE